MSENKLRRVYTGVLNNHMTGMQRNELKSYLKGEPNFTYGFHSNGERMFFPVRQDWLSQEDYESFVNKK
jgi:hypothetical protein